MALRLVGVGWYVGLCILLGVWGGLWLDNWLNTRPAFVLVGLFIGLAAAVYGVYRMLLPAMVNRPHEENH